MTTREFIQKIDNGEAKVLTLEAAKKLKGKTIYWTYFCYEGNEMSVGELTVGDIVSEWEYESHQPMKGFSSRAAYWDSYMTNAKKEYFKHNMLLLDDQGKAPWIYCELIDGLFSVPTFCCSDSDRCVYYIEK